MEENVAVFTTKMDGRNCIYVNDEIREFLGAGPGDFLEVHISVKRRVSADNKSNQPNSVKSD